MTHLPSLKVVPVERIRPHEEVDPLRVDRLARRIGDEGAQLNPMVCIEEADLGEWVLLDGATRTAALKRLGLGFAVVQIVAESSVVLETWHHVVTFCTPAELIAAVRGRPGLRLAEDAGPPRIWTPDGMCHSVFGESLSPNGALTSLVGAYVGLWTVNRMIEVDPSAASERFPEWAALVEFPALSIEDVMKAAIGDDLLPAGITRFIVPDRALRLNITLDFLGSPGTESEKQARLEAIMADRAREGRIRRYDEPVIILDD
jgi:hypothetical protein